MAERGRLDQLLVDEIHALGQPTLHPIDLALVGTSSRFQTPSPGLARLSLAHLVREPVNQSEQIRFGKTRLTQALPPVHPELPEIRIAEQPSPPRRVEERACIPAPGTGVSLIGRSKGAVKIPVRAVSDLPAARFVEVGAESQSVDISAEHFQNVEVDPGIDVDVRPIALDGILPIRTLKNAVELVEVGRKILALWGALRQLDEWLFGFHIDHPGAASPEAVFAWTQAIEFDQVTARHFWRLQIIGAEPVDCDPVPA